MPHGYLALGVQRVWEAAGGSGEQREGGGESEAGADCLHAPPQEGLARAQEDGHSWEPALPQGARETCRSHKHSARPDASCKPMWGRRKTTKSPLGLSKDGLRSETSVSGKI